MTAIPVCICGCGRPHHARGFSRVCYSRARRAGLIEPERLGELRPCACGCGGLRRERDPGGVTRRYIRGHQPGAGRRRYERRAIACACGCGALLLDRGNGGRVKRYVRGHSSRARTAR